MAKMQKVRQFILECARLSSAMVCYKNVFEFFISYGCCIKVVAMADCSCSRVSTLVAIFSDLKVLQCLKLMYLKCT